MTGNKAAKKTSRGIENPPSPTTRGKNQDGGIDGLLHENVRNAISSLLQNDADIMKAIVAAVTEAVLSELTGNTVFVSNMVEAITKLPIWVDTSCLLATTDMRTDRQTDRQNSNLVSSPSHYAIVFSIIPFTSSPSHHPLYIIPFTSSPSNHNRNLTSN